MQHCITGFFPCWRFESAEFQFKPPELAYSSPFIFGWIVHDIAQGNCSHIEAKIRCVACTGGAVVIPVV